MKTIASIFLILTALFANPAHSSEYSDCLNAVCPASIPQPYRAQCLSNEGVQQCAGLPGDPNLNQCPASAIRSCLEQRCPPSIPYQYRQQCLQSQSNIDYCEEEACG